METNPNCRDKDEGEDIECDEGEFQNEAGWKETDEGDEGDEGDGERIGRTGVQPRCWSTKGRCAHFIHEGKCGSPVPTSLLKDALVLVTN